MKLKRLIPGNDNDKPLPPWERDFLLTSEPEFRMFEEYLEMGESIYQFINLFILQMFLSLSIHVSLNPSTRQSVGLILNLLILTLTCLCNSFKDMKQLISQHFNHSKSSFVCFPKT